MTDPRIIYAHDGEADPKKLLLDEENPNEMTKTQFEALKESIRQFGILQPIVIDDAHRTMAAKELNMEKVKVIRMKLASEIDRRIIRQILNKLKGKHDPLKDANEFLAILKANQESTLFSTSAIKETEFYKTLQAIANTETEDLIPEIPENPVTQLGDIWQMGEHRLVCGDSLVPETYTALMQGDKAHLLLSDPPYNVAYASLGLRRKKEKIANDAMSEEDFMAFMLKFGQAVNPSLEGESVIYLCHRDTGRHAIPFYEIFQKTGWVRSTTIIWSKNNASMGWQDYRSQHECISYGWKGEKHFFAGDRFGTTIWNIKRDAVLGYEHITQKPVEIAERMIVNSSKDGEIVLDPFAGSGFSLMAAHKLGRKWRGCEINPGMVDVVVKRFEHYTGMEAKKV